jgi:hypothetical protein
MSALDVVDGEQPIDTGTAAGKCFLDIRQSEGSWRLRGAARLDRCLKVQELKAQGLGATEIAKALKIGWASIYRVLDAAPQ